MSTIIPAKTGHLIFTQMVQTASREETGKIEILVPNHRLSHQAGLTLVELLVVLTILGLLSALAVPVVGRLLPGVQLNALSDQVVAEVRFARQQAIAEGRQASFNLDLGERHFYAAGRNKRTIPDTVNVTFVFARQFMVSPSKGEVRFYPDGTSSGGRIEFTEGERGQRIHIDWFNGLAKNEPLENK